MTAKEMQEQRAATDSPWTFRERVRVLLWECCWTLFCVWTPKPLNAWRLVWLRLFGARVDGCPFVHQRARIQAPHRLVLHESACLGDRANLYSLGRIEIGARAVVAQEAYLCAGSHDFSTRALPLRTAPIVVGADVFIGARALVLQGVTIGEGAVIGAGSVVTRDVAPWTVCAGNPCRFLKTREPLP